LPTAGRAARLTIGVASAPWGAFALAVDGDTIVAAAPGRTSKEAIGGLGLPGGRTVPSSGADELARAVVEDVSGVGTSLAKPVRFDGTPFQESVWKALISIPPGRKVTYSELAELVGRPSAVRAVASACAANRIGLIVPCHRAVRADGGSGGYRWGEGLKASILELERDDLSRDLQTPGTTADSRVA
jgi:AraC family transcriptional regulator of adaptative response/methylated-DNA-[protein]-cysteine methyltransferase